MNTTKLYRLLSLPQEVVQQLDAYAASGPQPLDGGLVRRYLQRSTAQAAYEELCAALGDDPCGMKLLYHSLELAVQAHSRYASMGIGDGIYTDTMRFLTRFLHASRQESGAYRYTWGWWFWRQLALLEFRVGCLEYELAENDGERFISLHIPADADLRPDSVDASFAAFHAFIAAHYPEYAGVPWRCDSWMLSPALTHLLPEGSNVRAFKERFDVIRVEEESLGVLDWVFPPHKQISSALPEDTSLQRSMKAWLLAGGHVGWTLGVLRR